MKLSLTWSTQVTETYRAEIELADEHAARLAELLGTGVDLRFALRVIEDETDNVFDLGELAAENELLGNQVRSDTGERFIQAVGLA